MFEIKYGICVVLLAALAACGQQDGAGSANTLSEADGANEAHSKNGPNKSDSTLQVLEEATVHALGGSKEEIRFDKDTLELKTSAKVTLKLVNEGTEQSMIHNVVITSEGTSQAVATAGAAVGASGNYVPKSPDVIASSPLALPGQTVEINFESPVQAVAYDFICTYPEHRHTRVGKIIIK